MAGYNRVVMIGNLTRDPDYRQLPSGQAVCRLGLATNRQFKNRQTGSMVQEVCYVDIDVWGAQAESCRQYLQKGRAILVEGRLKFDTWEDPNGQNRSKHSIVADRVVFLSTQSAETTERFSQQDTNSDDLTLDPNNPVEKDLMQQLEKAKDKVKAATAEKKTKKAATPKAEQAPSTGEIDFKDQPPFEDNLPF